MEMEESNASHRASQARGKLLLHFRPTHASTAREYTHDCCAVETHLEIICRGWLLGWAVGQSYEVLDY